MPTSSKPPDAPGAGGPAARDAGTFVVLGRILGAHGVNGWVKVRPFTEDSEGLLGQPAWSLRQAGVMHPAQVCEARPHGTLVLARLEGIVDRGAAEALRGADVIVSREQLPAPETGEYYWSDLIGLAVRNTGGTELGRIAGLIAAPAHDVLRVVADGAVEGQAAQERLIPFVDPILREVNMSSGFVVVDWEVDY